VIVQADKQVHYGQLPHLDSRAELIIQLGTCFAKIDLPTFTERVLDALKDHNDVKPLALMLLLRLGQLAPTSIIPRLDDTVESFRTIMKDVEVKDDTVKQDLERKGTSSIENLT
jgi:hypothetical protein